MRAALQREGMDEVLRNKLWNVFADLFHDLNKDAFYSDVPSDNLAAMARLLWHDFYGLRTDTIPREPGNLYSEVRQRLSVCKWNEVYDFMEFVAMSLGGEFQKRFTNGCNIQLEVESSAYRFVGNKIAELTGEAEVAAVEQALRIEGPLSPVQVHLQRSLELFTDRKAPDYRNSIKESICAVESVCKLLTKNPKASLEEAITNLEKKARLHGALRKSFLSLYGYTSDAGGIRHALLDESKHSLEDAKFMLVSCSAFVNYLVSLAAKNGIAI